MGMDKFNFPKYITSVRKLEEVLVRPSAKTIESVASYNNDIMILGACGKICHTMATMVIAQINGDPYAAMRGKPDSKLLDHLVNKSMEYFQEREAVLTE